MAFTIICIHPIVGCKYLKILKEGEYYFFNDWYREENGHIIRNEDNTFKKGFFGNGITIQAVVGKNGAGKTTLLRLLAGEMQLDRDDHRGMSSGAHGKETACKNSLGIVTSRNITIGMLRQVDSSNQDKTIEEILLESCPDRDTYSKERFDYEMEYDRLFTGFGFEKEEDYEVFMRLINVRGIGPKSALNI